MTTIIGLCISAIYALLMIILRLKGAVNTTCRRFVFISLNVTNIGILAFMMEMAKAAGNQNLWFLSFLLIFVFVGVNLFFGSIKRE
ncbi:hypothetical protein [Candidatus Sororendozoicomonas aggregata]|uniref:hypothetical protein n=1 Tax=Candidatus Sororendozoicomonas aggregata TaxID=3073239 RepID=UPI002ED63235